jgi:hypothetical protein
MSDTSAELLTAHHLPYRVVNVIEDAKEFVVLVTAYLEMWTHLEHAIRGAVARRVPVTAILRTPDGSKREQDKKRDAAKHLEGLGATVHFVERLHAKAYINEGEAIVTSFNLVRASQDSIELGVHIQDPELVRDCLRKVSAYCPELSKPVKPTAKPAGREAQPKKEDGFCIGCAESHPVDPTKPMCRSCYRSSKRGADPAALPKRSCHFCGSDHAATLDRPICIKCWKALSKTEQDDLLHQIRAS